MMEMKGIKNYMPGSMFNSTSISMGGVVQFPPVFRGDLDVLFFVTGSV
jgi:hypothetical protein